MISGSNAGSRILSELNDDLARLDARNARRAELLAQVREAYPDLAAEVLADSRVMTVRKATLARRRPVAGRLLRRWIETHGKPQGWPDHGSLSPLLDEIEDKWLWNGVRLALLLFGLLLMIAAVGVGGFGVPHSVKRNYSLQMKFWQFGERVTDVPTLSLFLAGASLLMLGGAVWLRWRHRRNAAAFAAALEADLYRIVFGRGGTSDCLVGRMLRGVKE